MVLNITKHEISLHFLTKRIWIALACTTIIFSLLYQWLLKQFIIVSQAHILDGTHMGVTEEILHPYFAWLAIFIMCTLPILTVYSIIKDRNSGVFLLYQLAPINMSKYLLGHFSAKIILSYIIISFLSLLPCIIVIDTHVDILQLASAYIGVILLATCIISISTLAAVIANNIISAMGITYFIIVSLSLLEWCAQFTNEYYYIIKSIALLSPIKNFLSGNIFAVDILYYVYISTVCLIIAVAILNSKEDRYGY